MAARLRIRASGAARRTTTHAADAKDLMGVISAREMLAVLQKTDANGKPVHSNDASRNAALAIELNADEIYTCPISGTPRPPAAACQ
jgi:hypothetical protein